MEERRKLYQCQQHSQMMEWLEKIVGTIGKHDAHIDLSIKNQDELFKRLRNIETLIEKRGVVNQGIDAQINKLSEIASMNQININKLKDHVENGLSSRTINIEATVKELHDCIREIERKKELAEAVAGAGVQGFLSSAWEDFKKKIGWLIPFALVWFVLWILLKMFVWREIPHIMGIK